jgi:hypothetical protein
MMHRCGWTGNRAPSNTPHCWLVWEDGAPREFPQDFDWPELLAPATIGLAGMPAAINTWRSVPAEGRSFSQRALAAATPVRIR